jgi:hypothetical protein
MVQQRMVVLANSKKHGGYCHDRLGEFKTGSADPEAPAPYPVFWQESIAPLPK